MSFEVLRADGTEAETWRALVVGLPPERRDIHFLPEYGRIYRRSHGFEPLLAVYQTRSHYALQAFVRRPLRDLPFLADVPNREKFFDIASPYGFGGPVCSAEGSAAARDLFRLFSGEFGEWCREARIASEFACLHPLLAEHQRNMVAARIAPRHEKDVVVIDLRVPEPEILRGLRKGHRSSITLARRRGAQVAAVAPTSNNLTVFHSLYVATMERRQAAARWFLPLQYFADTVSELGWQRVSLLFAQIGNAVESACLLMHDFGTAYYHFAATRGAFTDSGVNNLLVWEAAMLARAGGCHTLHLGGGITSDPDDSLLRFKTGFSNLRLPLYTYVAVRHADTYHELCEYKRAYERVTLGRESDSDFLPLYRRYTA